MTTLAEKIQKYETVKRENCRDCGNPWWFSEEHSYVCTTCAKTSGRSTGDEYKPKAAGKVPTHKKSWACIKPDGDGCDGRHDGEDSKP